MPIGDAVIKCRVRRAVSDYIAHHRDEAVAELDFYRAMPILRHVIKAPRASEQRRTGGCHLPLPGRHQRRPQALRMDQDR